MQTHLDFFLNKARPALTALMADAIREVTGVPGPLPPEFAGFLEETMTHMMQGLLTEGSDRQAALSAIRRAAATDMTFANSMMQVWLLFHSRAEVYFQTELAANPVLLTEVLRRFRNFSAAAGAQVAASRVDHMINRLSGPSAATVQRTPQRYIK